MNAGLIILGMIVGGIAIRVAARFAYHCKVSNCGIHNGDRRPLNEAERFNSGLIGFGSLVAVSLLHTILNTPIGFAPFFVIPVGLASLAALFLGAYLEDRVDSREIVD